MNNKQNNLDKDLISNVLLFWDDVQIEFSFETLVLRIVQQTTQNGRFFFYCLIFDHGLIVWFTFANRWSGANSLGFISRYGRIQ